MEIIQLIIGWAGIISVVAVIWAVHKVMKIYGITVDRSGLDKWEYGSDPITGKDDWYQKSLNNTFKTLLK
ncbi:hypothetical protein [Candidatus Thiothrix anitrata]|uniref:Uncharacterized protein n=1 Tax=Candidatus Thiothrix anitrata TaxID=2823902 RepID=A0ABX7X8M4_9GAMM|nr:hypothetical protein [Candidatus Thiothrix anitrata]QTR51582.1 hypothetical protein J8380_08595 [Candidatus Thiothrix anitrata]